VLEELEVEKKIVIIEDRLLSEARIADAEAAAQRKAFNDLRASGIIAWASVAKDTKQLELQSETLNFTLTDPSTGMITVEMDEEKKVNTPEDDAM